MAQHCPAPVQSLVLLHALWPPSAVHAAVDAQLDVFNPLPGAVGRKQQTSPGQSSGPSQLAAARHDALLERHAGSPPPQHTWPCAQLPASPHQVPDSGWLVKVPQPPSGWVTDLGGQLQAPNLHTGSTVVFPAQHAYVGGSATRQVSTHAPPPQSDVQPQVPVLASQVQVLGAHPQSALALQNVPVGQGAPVLKQPAGDGAVHADTTSAASRPTSAAETSTTGASATAPSLVASATSAPAQVSGKSGVTTSHCQ